MLDRRPKFYGCSRRFKTYGYGYSGRSLRPFLRRKVLFVVFFPKWRLKCKLSCVFSIQVPLVFTFDWFGLSLKIKTRPFLMRSFMEMSLDLDYVKLSTKWWTAVFIKFTNLVWICQNFYDTCFTIFYPTASAEVFQGRTAPTVQNG